MVKMIGLMAFPRQIGESLFRIEAGQEFDAEESEVAGLEETGRAARVVMPKTDKKG